MIEADRVLVYLGFFLAAFLIAQTDKGANVSLKASQSPSRWSPCSALGSRLLPHVLEVARLARQRRRACATRSATGTRTARCSGSPSALLLWMSRQRALGGAALALGRRRCRRCCSPSTSPTRAAACWRCVVAAGCLLALSRDRLWLLATLAIGALGALPAVLAVQARRSLADNLAGQAAVDQGVTVLLILLAGIALALLLFAGAAPARAARRAR